MKMHVEDGIASLMAENAGERALLASLADRWAGVDLRCAANTDSSLDLGPSVPINITFDAAPMPQQLISNLAKTPFELDGRRYASIEGFWQGLKFPGEVDRQRIAALSGHDAKKAGPSARPGDRFFYDRREVCVGTVDHWALMENACRAKFTQHDGARAALLSTGAAPLEHKVTPDSRTIPGLIMADIWTRIRTEIS